VNGTDNSSKKPVKLFSTANIQNNSSNVKNFSPEQSKSPKKIQKVVPRPDQIVTASTQSDEGIKINDLIQSCVFDDFD
jgi:hypothetical protein